MFSQTLNYELLAGITVDDTVDSSQQWVLAAMQNYGQDLINMLWRILSNEQDVCDVYQSTFLRLAHFQGGEKPEYIKAYVFKTASNTAISMLRTRISERKRITNSNQTQKIAESPENELNQKQLIETMQYYITKLPEHLQNVLTLRDLGELSYKQIARILGISAGTARVYRSKAIALLGAWMSKNNENSNL
jgi:RNA polymerase sigma-70 factor (ECF subfamily)